MNLEYEELKSEFEKVMLECTRLKEENKKLRNQLGLAIKDEDAKHRLSVKVQKGNYSPETVNKYSSPSEKIKLYSTLFKGREDIYAARWESKNGKVGYSPVCTNEWRKGICEKSKVKCSECNNRVFRKFDDRIIGEHLSGSVIIGIYPLLKDETCNFLAVDFDKQNWNEDVKAFIETCREKNIPAAIERSRSGNGAHVWIFFEKTVNAYIARKVGSYLLTCTMEKRYEIGLESYDRLFPNQDTMPQGGFGNLIALPLQKIPRERGNSVFIDDDLIPYEDQWYFLSNLKKMTSEEVEKIVNTADNEAKESVIAKEQILIKKKFSDEKKETISIDCELPEKVKILQESMIYIEKQVLPSKIINEIIRTAAFSNPEFYRAQALRLPTHNKPRLISCSDINSEYIMVPRGCLEEVEVILQKYKIGIDIVDNRTIGNTIEVEFKGQLTDAQIDAAENIIAYENGVICANTGFGKTVLAAWLIGERKVNTLILVHRRQLLEQWKDRLATFLNIDIESIGQIGGGKSSRTGIIDIGIMQSLYDNRNVKEFVKDYGQVIIDECHHLAAFSFEQVMKTVKAKYICGLTATPIRKDGHHQIIMMQCGPIRYKVNSKDISKMNEIERIVIKRNTQFKFSAYEEGKTSINDIYRALIEDESRNNMIFGDILNVLEERKSPILLTERRSHIDYFEEKFKGFVKNIIVLRGGMGKRQGESVRKHLKNIPDNEERLIIASGKYVGEGFDDSRLDTLFLVMPISWKGTLQQYAGRLHRNHHNKKVVKIFDYVDNEIPMLNRMFEKRVKGYKNMGYDMK
jgi:superfamily II DNA or RNA helicase